MLHRAPSPDPVFGTAGGAFLSLSDLLGNEQYYFLIYNTAESQDELLSSFNLAISRLSLGQRTNYAYGVFHFSGYRHDLTDPDLYYWERSFGGYFALSYPISKFQRVEANVTVSNSDKDVLTGNLPRLALLVSNSFSFVWDNSLWGPTGPLDSGRGTPLLQTPTANIETSNELIPGEGVYAAKVSFVASPDGPPVRRERMALQCPSGAVAEVYDGIANIGRNPTFDDTTMSYEVHLFGYRGDLIGRRLRLHFLEKIRDEKRFSGAGDLKRQIERDIEAAARILARKSTPLYL